MLEKFSQILSAMSPLNALVSPFVINNLIVLELEFISKGIYITFHFIIHKQICNILWSAALLTEFNLFMYVLFNSERIFPILTHLKHWAFVLIYLSITELSHGRHKRSGDACFIYKGKHNA